MSQYHEQARKFVKDLDLKGWQIEDFAFKGLTSGYSLYLQHELMTTDKYHGLTPLQVQEHCQWLEMIDSVDIIWEDSPRDPGWVLRYFSYRSRMWNDLPLDARTKADAVKEAARLLADGADPDWVEKGLSLKMSA